MIKVPGLVGLGLEIRFWRFPIGVGSVWLRYLEQLIIFECPPSSGSIQKVKKFSEFSELKLSSVNLLCDYENQSF